MRRAPTARRRASGSTPRRAPVGTGRTPTCRLHTLPTSPLPWRWYGSVRLSDSAVLHHAQLPPVATSRSAPRTVNPPHLPRRHAGYSHHRWWGSANSATAVYGAVTPPAGSRLDRSGEARPMPRPGSSIRAPRRPPAIPRPGPRRHLGDPGRDETSSGEVFSHSAPAAATVLGVRVPSVAAKSRTRCAVSGPVSGWP